MVLIISSCAEWAQVEEVDTQETGGRQKPFDVVLVVSGVGLRL
jgi:hypothetical protein